MESVRKKIKRETSSNLFMYAAYMTFILSGFLMLYLRNHNKWIGEILPLGDEYSTLLFAVLELSVYFIYLFTAHSESVMDCLTVGTLSVTLYINTLTVIMYPWMRWMGVIYYLLPIVYMVIFHILNNHKDFDRRYIIKEAVWSGLRLWTIPSMLLVIICLILCAKERDKIEDEKYNWLRDDNYRRVSSDEELKELRITDFRHDRFSKLSSDQREYLVEMLVKDTMNYLTEGACVPTVDYLYGREGQLGDSDYEEMTICFNLHLYNIQTKEDVEKFAGVIFHECFHIYEHYCIESLVENDRAASALYYRQIKAWEENEDNYISNDFFAYKHQPLEEDAEEFSQKITKIFMEYVYNDDQ